MAALRPVDLDWIDRAPVHHTTEGTLRHPPARVFAALAADPAGWGRWFPGFSGTGHYVGDGPYGTGSVRQVRAGGIRFSERVLAWEEPSRWAFRAEEASSPWPKALAEDYRLAPTPAGGSRLSWTLALDPGPVPPLVLTGLPAVLRLLMRRITANLDRHLDGG